MGWASGSSLMGAIIGAVRANVSDEAVREKIYLPIFREFRNDDWDTVDECIGDDPAFDNMLRKEDPRYFYDEDDDEEYGPDDFGPEDDFEDDFDDEDPEYDEDEDTFAEDEDSQ